MCFPYTSRDEITTAVKHTVEAYSTPLGTNQNLSKRPFSETHITHHIRQQMLMTVPEGAESPESRSSSPSAKEHGSAEEGALSATSTALNSSDQGDSLPIPSFRDPETITADILTENMFTADAPPLDLLIRTSGVRRLSDFMLWQCHEKTSIVFLDCMWPEFDLWQFLPVLVEWQWQKKKLLEHSRSNSRLPLGP